MTGSTATSAKVHLTLTAEAIAILDKNATERKRGEFMSNLLVAFGAGAGAINQVDIESMRLQMLGLASTTKTLDARLSRLERHAAAK